MKIPYEKLAPETLHNIIEEFVTRSGVGDVVSVDDQVQHIHNQLAKGSIVIVFDAETESCSIMPERDYQRLARQVVVTE